MTWGGWGGMTWGVGGDVEFFDEPGAGFGEGEVLVVLYQADDVATFTADETFVDVLLFVDVHRGVGIVVIPALGAFGEFAHAAEGDAELGADIENGQVAEFLNC